MVRIADVEGERQEVRAGLNVGIGQPSAIGRERIWQQNVLAFEEPLRFTSPVSADPPEGLRAGVRRIGDVLSVGCPDRPAVILRGERELRHRFELQIVDQNVSYCCCTDGTDERQTFAIGREAGDEIYTRRGPHTLWFFIRVTPYRGGGM